VVVGESETSTFADVVAVPMLEVPPEPTMRPMPFNVTSAPDTTATLPEADANEKLPPPNPPPAPPIPPPPAPPNPPPPAPRPPPNPPEADGQGVESPVTATERAATGPAAEPEVDGVPVAVMHVPATRSWAVPATVWVNVVAELQRTDVVPENELCTVIEDPETVATEPEATGRRDGDVVEVPTGAAPWLELGALEQLAARRARAPTTTAPRPARRPGTVPARNADRTFIVSPPPVLVRPTPVDLTGVLGPTTNRPCFRFAEKPLACRVEVGSGAGLRCWAQVLG
jgi:hypothetical protein